MMWVRLEKYIMWLAIKINAAYTELAAGIYSLLFFPRRWHMAGLVRPQWY